MAKFGHREIWSSSKIDLNFQRRRSVGSLVTRSCIVSRSPPHVLCWMLSLEWLTNFLICSPISLIVECLHVGRLEMVLRTSLSIARLISWFLSTSKVLLPNPTT